MTIKVSDYIANFFAEKGLSTVYMVTGGGAMHLNHSLGQHPKLTVIFNHHEQACAMAAESHARLTGQPALVNVTTGPGGVNAINGVFGAWTDSIPMIILSGQVRYDTTVTSSPLPLRQLGDQEVDIISMVTPVTKYAHILSSTEDIAFHLEKAFFLANEGRPGPVWLDIPMCIQGSLIDPDTQHHFTPPTDTFPKIKDDVYSELISRIKSAERPVLMVGGGIRAAGMHDAFMTLIELLKLPVVSGWNAHDVLANDHPYYAGRPGTVGDRAGNFVVQNADLLLVLGSRLNIRQVSYNWTSFARGAYKIMVDADQAEMDKPTLSIDQKIFADLRTFIPGLIAQLQLTPLSGHPEWVAWGKKRVAKYPVVLPEYWDIDSPVNPYCLISALSDMAAEDQIVVTGDGTACVTSFQAWKIQRHQRLYTNSGSASMGYDLPAAIGACVASGGKEILCLAGDGSIQMNLQELATIAHHRFPIKVFWLNNGGYHSIRQTQRNYFGSFVGCDDVSGLGFPSAEKIATAYGLPYFFCDRLSTLNETIQKAYAAKGPVICEIMLLLSQDFSPKLSSKRLPDGRMISSPLEDLAPFLSESELLENMIIPLEQRI